MDNCVILEKKKILPGTFQSKLEKAKGNQLYIDSFSGNQFNTDYLRKTQEVDKSQDLQGR